MTTGNEPDEFQRLLNGYAEEPEAPAAPPAPGEPPAPRGPAGPAPADPWEERPASTPEADAKRALFRKVLEEEGYRFEVDEDGDISFRREGKWLVLFVDDDPTYFRLSMPNVFECGSEEQADLAVQAANELNRSYKVAKLVVVDGWVWANVEMFLRPMDAFRSTFERCLDLLAETAGDFRRRMRRPAAERRAEPVPSPAELPPGSFAR